MRPVLASQDSKMRPVLASRDPNIGPEKRTHGLTVLKERVRTLEVTPV